MGKIIIDTQTCRREAERLRKTAGDIQNIRSRLTALSGETAEVWQGAASNALAGSQEYTLNEFSRLIALIEEAADDLERIAADFEQAEKNIAGGIL